MTAPYIGPSDVFDVKPDHLALPIALAVKDCLCDGLAKAGVPVCRCALDHGMTVPADDCGCDCAPGFQGQAWVRLMQIRQLESMNDARSGTRRDVCSTVNAWTLTFEMGVLRCVQMTDEAGHVPPLVREAEAALFLTDAMVMRQVVYCCPMLEDSLRYSIVWTPLPTQGGCGGGALTFMMDVTPNWAREKRMSEARAARRTA